MGRGVGAARAPRGPSASWACGPGAPPSPLRPLSLPGWRPRPGRGPRGRSYSVVARKTQFRGRLPEGRLVCCEDHRPSGLPGARSRVSPGLRLASRLPVILRVESLNFISVRSRLDFLRRRNVHRKFRDAAGHIPGLYFDAIRCCRLHIFCESSRERALGSSNALKNSLSSKTATFKL